MVDQQQQLGLRFIRSINRVVYIDYLRVKIMCNYVNYLKCFVAYLIMVNQGIFRKGNRVANCTLRLELHYPCSFSYLFTRMYTLHEVVIFFWLEKITLRLLARYMLNK